jgi:carbonic anhydrase/acetyltransferase-like protein (isoleucine patch superfamily)
VPIYEFAGKKPKVHETAWVAPNADLIGDVRVEPRCYIGWAAVLRGDHGAIYIQEGTAIEEGVIMHTSKDFISRIGVQVTVGHGALLHSATVEDFAVIGMRATLSNNSIVGRWSIIGEAGLVKANQVVPSEVIAVGQPVQVIGPIEERHRERWLTAKRAYQEFASRNKSELRLMAKAGGAPD